jgi:cytochrome b
MSNTAPERGADIPVWDRFVRVGHWMLAAAFLIAYVTEDDLLTIHVWAGYVALAIVLMRIVWGFVGPQHARFRDFLYSPLDGWRYLTDLLRGRARRYLGHSPAGATMVYALLVGVLATTISGLFVYAYEEHAGPLAAFVTQTSTPTITDDEHSKSEADEVWEEIHEVLANVTLALVGLHIAGVVLASLAHRENLLRAMISGRKRP